MTTKTAESSALSTSIRDVARRAGVSITTVSHALNDKGRVNPATRAKVITAAKALGYIPNAHARGLVTGRNLTIAAQFGVGHADAVVPRSTFQLELLNGASKQALALGYTLFLFAREATPDSVEAVTPGGALAIDPVEGQPFLTAMAQRRIPIVTVGRPPLSVPVACSVDNDHKQATHKALTHLDRKGYRRLALLTVGTDSSFSRDAIDAYHEWSTAHNNRPVVAVADEEDGAHALENAATRLLRSSPRPDGVYATGDDLALAVRQAARGLAITVPDKLGIIGAMDPETVGPLDSSLTSVVVNADALGREAVRVLISVIDNPVGSTDGEPQSITIPTRIAPGASTNRTR